MGSDGKLARPSWDNGVQWLARKVGICTFDLILQCLAELWGTALIVIFGCGIQITGFLVGETVGLLQITIIWAIGVAIAIYTTYSISGGHLNPALSLAYALARPKDFPFYKLPCYIIAQLLGGMLGGFANIIVFGSVFDAFERIHDIDRGDPNSLMTAMVFGSYFPNPAITQQPFDEPDTSDHFFDGRGVVSLVGALCVEAWATFLLCFVVFSLTHPRSNLFGSKQAQALAPAVIGGTVGALLSIYYPLTQVSLNPARDFGPRLIAWLYGWDSVAIPGPRDGFWIYIAGPMVGGPLGAAFHDLIMVYGLFCPLCGDPADSGDSPDCKKVLKAGSSSAAAIAPADCSPSQASPTAHCKTAGKACDAKPSAMVSCVPEALSYEPPIVVSSLRVITETEISEEKLSLSVDETMEAHAAERKAPNSVHICQFFHVSSNMIVDDSPTSAGGDKPSTAKYLKPLAQVKCTVDECAIPRTVIQKASLPDQAAASGTQGGAPDEDPGYYLVLFVSVKK